MKRKVTIAAVAVVLLALLGAALWLVRPSPGPLEAVPAESLLVADVDFQALRQTPLFGASRELLSRRVPIDKIDQACGFATLQRLERGVLTVGEGEAGGVGLALAGTVAKEELLHCQTQLVIGATGVTKNELAASTTHGQFLLTPLKLADVALVLGMGLKRPLLVATPAWIERMADAADAPEKSSFGRFFEHGTLLPEPHRTAREKLESAAAGLPLLIGITAKMPKGQNAMLASLVQFLPTPELVKLAQKIHDLKSAGVSVTTSDAGKRTTIRLVVDAGEPAVADALRDVLLGTRLSLSQNMMIRVMGFGKLLDAFKAESQGSWLVATIDDTTDAILDDVTKLQELGGR